MSIDPPDEKTIFLNAHNEYADAIFRHCYFKLFDRDKAHDVTQETFVRTWKYMSAGNTIENIRAFLYRVANNVIIDELRKAKVISLDAIQEQGFDPPSSAHEQDIKNLNAKDAIRLLSKIEPHYREVIAMRYVDELAVREIAKILDETENTVSVRLHRGLNNLRALYLHG